MTRRVSFEVLTLAGACLLICMAIRAWHLSSAGHFARDYYDLAFCSIFVLFVWFSCR